MRVQLNTNTHRIHLKIIATQKMIHGCKKLYSRFFVTFISNKLASVFMQTQMVLWKNWNCETVDNCNQITFQE